MDRRSEEDTRFLEAAPAHGSLAQDGGMSTRTSDVCGVGVHYHIYPEEQRYPSDAAQISNGSIH